MQVVRRPGGGQRLVGVRAEVQGHGHVGIHRYLPTEHAHFWCLLSQ